MAENDFFLNFGSNAGDWASKLSGEVQPATQSIIELINALNDYDGTVAKVRGQSSPINSLFERLDHAAAQFSELSGTLNTTFSKAITGVDSLRLELVELVNEIQGLDLKRKKVQASSATGIAGVTESDVQDVNKRQRKALADILEGNAITARNALKRVADINNTVARAAGGAADQLSLLGEAIRDLRANSAKAREDLGHGLGGGGGVNLILAGGGAENLTGAGVNAQGLIDALTKQLGGTAAKGATTPPAATDAAADAIAMRAAKGVHPLGADDLSQLAKPGRYSVLGGESRPVGFDVYTDRGETFEQYFARKDRETAAVQRIRETMPQGDPADLKAYNTFRATGGKQKDEIFNRVIGSPTMTMEQIKASYDKVQLGALTEREKQELPDILRRVNALKQAQMEHATKGLTSLLQANPFMSFQGGVLAEHDPKREVGNIVAQALKEIDEKILSTTISGGSEGGVRPSGSREESLLFGGAEPGARFRAEARDTGAAHKRIDYKSSNTGEYENATIREASLKAPRTTSARLTEAKALQERAETDYKNAAEGDREAAAIALEAANANLASVRREANELQRARKQRLATNKAATQEFISGPRSPEQIRAQAERGKDVAAVDAQIRRLREQGGTAANNAEVAGMLGIQPTTSRDLIATNQGMEGLQARASASGLRSILQSNPDVIISKLAQEQEDFIRRATGIKSHNTDVAASRESLGRLQDPATAQTEADRILQERMHAGLSGFEQAQVRHGFNVTEDQHSEAVARLEAQRETLIQEGIQRLTAAGAVAPDTPGTTRDPAPARRARQPREDVTAPHVATPSVSVDELTARRADIIARRGVLKNQIESSYEGGFHATKNLEPGPDLDAFLALRGEFNNLGLELRPVNKELHALKVAAADAARAEAKKATAGGATTTTQPSEEKKTQAGGSGGAKPPRPPRPASAGGGDEPPDDEEPTKAKKSRPSKNNVPPADWSGHIQALSDDTKAELGALRAQLELTKSTEALTAEQREALLAAGHQYLQDPYVKKMDAATRSATFAQATGLDQTEGGLGYTRRLFSRETGYLQADPRYNRSTNAGGGGAGTSDHYEQTMASIQGVSGRVAVAMLKEAAAQDTLNRLRAAGTATDAQYLRAEASLMAAQMGVERALAADASDAQAGTLGRKMFGQRGFIDSQLRHFGQAIENIAGYTLVFAGFEKMRQLVDDGIQADAAFVRLQASLTATGRSAGNLRSQLASVSSATAQSLPAIVEAASELTGVFSKNAELVQGTKIAGELANISQGTLTAKEAAIGLRDVTDAYGISGVKRIQQVGDEIARLSQVTGVSVKDIVEGTTQLAQEAHSFGLNQRQAAVLSAFVTRSTGETGESAAEQVSRILSTLNTGNVQNLLTRTRIPGGGTLATREQFQAGDIGGVLTSLLTNFNKLPASSRQAITALVGTGRQARAFAGLIRDAAAAADEFNNTEGDVGSLANQNGKYLNSLAGIIKSLGNDFRNLGATLQQLGFFDLLGAMAKSLDEFLKLVNSVGQTLGHAFNSNDITRDLTHLIVMLGEAAVAFRLLRAVAGPALARIGIGSAGRAGGAAAGVGEEVAEDVALGGGFGGGTRRRYSTGVPVRRSAVLYGGQFLTPRTAARRVGALPDLRSPEASRVLTQGLVQESEVAAKSLGGRLGGAIRGLGLNALTSTLGIVAISLAIDQFGKSISGASSIAAAVKQGEEDLSGKTARDAKKKAAGVPTENTALQNAARSALSRSASPIDQAVDSARNLIHGNLDNMGVDLDTVHGVNINYSGGYTNFVKLLETRLRKAKGNVKGLDAADLKNQEDIQNYTQYIDSLGFNNNQKAVALAELENAQTSITGAYENLRKSASGIKAIDQINEVQAEALLNALDEAQQFTSETLRNFPEVVKQILADTGVPVGGAAYNHLKDALDGKSGFKARIKAQFDAANDAVKNLNSELADYAKLPIGPQRDAAIKSRDKAIQDRQNALQTMRQTDPANASGLSALAEATGNNQSAITDLQTANTSLTGWNKSLAHDDPQYIANLKTINDNKIKIAQLSAQDAEDITTIQIANAVSPLKKANLELTSALQKQAEVAAEPGGGSLADRTNAAAAVAAANLAQINAVNEQDYSTLELQIARLNDLENPAATAKASSLSASELQEKIRRYLKQGGVKGDATYNQLEAQLADALRKSFDDALAKTLAALDNLSRDTTDPVAEALLAVRKARAKLTADVKGKRGDPTQDRIQLGVALQAQQKAAFDQQLGDQQTAYDLHRESAGQFLTFLKSQDQLLRNQIAGMRKGTEGYRQRIDELNQIDQAILGLTSQMQGQFNLGSIKVPTVYEVRRQIAQNHVDASTTNNNVTINGVDIQQVINYINSILGPGATGSRTASATRKVPT